MYVFYYVKNENKISELKKKKVVIKKKKFGPLTPKINK